MTSQGGTRPLRGRGKGRVKQKAAAEPSLFAQIIGTIASLSAERQVAFLDELDDLVETFSGLLKSRIGHIDLNHAQAWGAVRGKPIGFVDGGVAALQGIGSAPVAIRVGTYVVTPGKVGQDREQFDMSRRLIGELFRARGEDTDAEAVYDRPVEQAERDAKMRDAARMITEASGALELVRRRSDLALLFVHGPLVNPVAPYAEIPPFTGHAAELLSGHPAPKNEDERHFIALYKSILEELHTQGPPTAGIVERSSSKSLIKAILDEAGGGVTDQEKRDIADTLKTFGITDTMLFAFLLEPGDYLQPLDIDKNLKSKAPDRWEPTITSYHHPKTTIIKATAVSMPFRLETWNDVSDIQFEAIMSLTFHMARLLPNYAFPIGIDIADKFAKFPNWLSTQLSRELSANLLRKAIESKDPDAIRRVQVLLASPRRDWLFRPTVGK